MTICKSSSKEMSFEFAPYKAFSHDVTPPYSGAKAKTVLSNVRQPEVKYFPF